MAIQDDSPMLPVAGQVQVDPKSAAELLEKVYFGLSQAVADFRINNWDQLDPTQRDLLKARSELLADHAHDCVAEALAAILDDIKPHLDNLKKTTALVRDALRGLRNLQKGLAIIGGVADLSVAIAGHQWGTLATRLDAIVQACTADSAKS